MLLRAFVATVALFLVAIAWDQYAPQSLGGPVEILTTRGNSMEPLFHEGDFVVIRKDHVPEVGEILAYHSDQINSVVLHRAVDLEDGRFILKGDNNDWLDPEQVSPDDVIGSYWFHVPGAGSVFSMLQNPVVATIFVMFTVMIIFLVLFARPQRTRSAARRS